MKKQNLIYLLFIFTVIVVAILFSNRLLIQNVESNEITVSDIEVHDENMIITFEVNNPDKHFEYIGGEWSNKYFDEERAIQCLMYKRFMFLHQNDKYCWSVSIPLEYTEQMSIYYGNEKSHVLVYESNSKTNLQKEKK